MTVILCLSEGGGMLFNKRRQSRDRKVISDVVAMLEGRPLNITDFSKKYLSENGIDTRVWDDPLKECGADDFVFVENLRLCPYAKKIKRLVIYKWNTVYPTDFRIDVEPEKLNMKLLSSIDFEGYSHDKITREIWER